MNLDITTVEDESLVNKLLQMVEQKGSMLGVERELKIDLEKQIEIGRKELLARLRRHE